MELVGQTVELIPAGAVLGPFAILELGADLAHAADHGNQIFGVPVLVHAIAQIVDALEGLIERAGLNQVAVLILLEATADIHVVALFAHIVQLGQVALGLLIVLLRNSLGIVHDYIIAAARCGYTVFVDLDQIICTIGQGLGCAGIVSILGHDGVLDSDVVAICVCRKCAICVLQHSISTRVCRIRGWINRRCLTFENHIIAAGVRCTIRII